MEVGPEGKVPQKHPDRKTKLAIESEGGQKRDGAVARQGYIEPSTSGTGFRGGCFRVQAFRVARGAIGGAIPGSCPLPRANAIILWNAAVLAEAR
jgi:hypothetical protein